MTNIAPPPDLEMLVRLRENSGQTKIEYELNSPNGTLPFHHFQVAGPTIAINPSEWRAAFLKRFARFSEGRDVDGSLLLLEEIDRRNTAIGRELWDTFFLSEMRRVYRRIREQVFSWMIVSEAQWIPWECIKPYDDSLPDQIIDDDFLGRRFQLTHWLPASWTPAGEIAVNVVACINSARDFPYAEREMELVRSFAQDHANVLDASSAAIGGMNLIKVLERGVDLVHFIGHSQSEPEPGILLADGYVLRPSDLSGPLKSSIASHRPFVFFNSESSSLAWVFQWIGRSGAGAFIFPQFPISDSQAFNFARTLYSELAAGATFGIASQRARIQTGLLAYRVYAHPNGRLRFPQNHEQIWRDKSPRLGAFPARSVTQFHQRINSDSIPILKHSRS